jgi:hypothetical protein
MDGEARVEFLRLLLRYLHLVGFALLIGAWVAQYLTGRLRVNVVMQTGLGTMIGTGLLLAIPFPTGVDLNYGKLGVKLVVAVGIGALFGIAVTRERAEKVVTRPLFLSIGGLALVNAAIAVFWR